jgi:hypothetical protein
MQKDKRTQKQRQADVKRGWKNHLREKSRKKNKNIKKEEKILKKAAEEKKFREHMLRLMGHEV